MDPTDTPPPQDREPSEQGLPPEDVSTPLRHEPPIGTTSEGLPASGTEPLTPVEAPKARGKIAALSLGIAVVLLAAGTFVAVRSGTTASKLDTLVPADALAFAEVTVKPSGSQRDALRSLLGRLPAERRDAITEGLTDQLDEVFEDGGLDYKSDVEPWIGERLAVSVRAPAEGSRRGPIVVALVEVEDEAAARAAFNKAKVSEEGEFFIEGGVAYLAEEMVDITSLRSAVEARGALSSKDSYVKETSSLGDTLAMAWFDGAGLQAAFGGRLGQSFPGLPFGAMQGQGTGVGAVALRASEQGLEVFGHSTGQGGQTPKTGKLALVESAPSSVVAALSIYNPAAVIDTIEQAMSMFGGGFGSTVGLRTVQELEPQFPFANADPFAQLGLDLDKDIKPWLQGELSVIVGGITAPPVPDMAILIEPTDDAAAKRALDRIESNLGGLGLSVQSTPDGFNVNSGFITVGVVRTNDRIVIASSPAYAKALSRASSSSLADDAVYKRAVGTSADNASFQLYVRIDRVQSLLETFLPADARAEYEKDAKPILDELESLGMRATSNGNEGTFSLKLTVRD